MVRVVRNEKFRAWFEEVTKDYRCCPEGKAGCDLFTCAYGEFVTRYPRMARRMWHWSRRYREGRPGVRLTTWSSHVIHKQYRAKRRHW